MKEALRETTDDLDEMTRLTDLLFETCRRMGAIIDHLLLKVGATIDHSDSFDAILNTVLSECGKSGHEAEQLHGLRGEELGNGPTGSVQ